MITNHGLNGMFEIDHLFISNQTQCTFFFQSNASFVLLAKEMQTFANGRKLSKSIVLIL